MEALHHKKEGYQAPPTALPQGLADISVPHGGL
jgi:hypothetical protein